MSIDRVRRLAFLTISQTGIRYRKSPLSHTLADLPQDAPQAGDRFPWLRLKMSAGGPVEDLFGKLDDTRFNLLVFGQAAAEAPQPGGLLGVHAIPDERHNATELTRARIPATSFYLLRPDGHVGLAGTRLESGAVTRYCPRAASGSRLRELAQAERLALPRRRTRPARWKGADQLWRDEGGGLRTVARCDPDARALAGLRGGLHHHFIHEAPAPVLAGLEALHDRVLRPVEVLGRVLALRVYRSSRRSRS